MLSPSVEWVCIYGHLVPSGTSLRLKDHALVPSILEGENRTERLTLPGIEIKDFIGKTNEFIDET